MRLCLLALIVAAAPADALASGFYNMPTSLQQCLGVGFGPGYHAPLLLGNPLKTRIAAQPLVRLAHPLPPPASAFAQPSCLGGCEAGSVHAYPIAPVGAPIAPAPPRPVGVAPGPGPGVFPGGHGAW